MGEKDKVRIMWMLGIIVGLGIVALVSAKFMGDDNPVEEVAEEIIEDTIESQFHIPDGTIKIDLTPGSKEV